ncbi:hypothetical protein [Streptomyces sp. NPDC058657]|uniref:hypothetical protein n=1 Tax=unclassified Streptomyces TaxID=2593676 RepID=UPI003658915E
MNSLIDRIFRHTAHHLETPMSTETTTADTAPAPTALMRFLTHGGAVVQVTEEQRTTFWDTTNPTGTWTVYPVHCLGCHYDHDSYTSPEGARDNANEHASTCRAMPKPTA